MPTASQTGIRAAIAARVMLWVCLPLCLPICFSLWAQRAERAARSTVTGRVVCADTNAPARLAKVTLNKLEGFSTRSG